MNEIEVTKKQITALSKNNKIGIVDILQLIRVNYQKKWKTLINRGLDELNIEVNDESIEELFTMVNIKDEMKIYLDEYVFEIKIIEENQDSLPKKVIERTIEDNLSSQMM